MNTVRQCLVLIPCGCRRDNVSAKCIADARLFYGSKGQKTSTATSCLLYFTSGPQDVSHEWPVVIIWMVQTYCCELQLMWLFFIIGDCFTNLRIFVLHLCWPLNCNIDGWGTIFIVLLGNLNCWSASQKNVLWCWSASLWYDTCIGPLQMGNELVRA